MNQKNKQQIKPKFGAPPPQNKPPPNALRPQQTKPRDAKQAAVRPDEVATSNIAKSEIDILAKFINANPQRQYVPHILMF